MLTSSILMPCEVTCFLELLVFNDQFCHEAVILVINS